MKVLMLNGSCKADGNTNCALEQIGKTLKEEGVDYEIYQLGSEPIKDCIGCRRCTDKGCVFEDNNVNAFIAKAKEADGLIFGTPVYYAHPSGRVLSFLDRVFYSSGKALAFKPGAAITVARRGGTTASFDVMNKYFGISQMPVVGSTYWNIVHGKLPGEAKFDEEGMQTMRNLARNMSWMIKCINAGKNSGIEFPKSEREFQTNFIR